MTAAFWSRFKRFLLSGTYLARGLGGMDLLFASGIRGLRGGATAQAVPAMDLAFASGIRGLRRGATAQAVLADASGDVSSRSRVFDGSTFTPGPIVEAITTERR